MGGAGGSAGDAVAARLVGDEDRLTALGHRSQGVGDRALDVLVPLAAALQVDLDALLDVSSDGDVVIRPVPSRSGERTTWMLSRPTAGTVAVKMRLEPTGHRPQQRVHPGHDWLFVLSGTLLLLLGDREITVETGQAAEFATMTPHAVAAAGGPVEVIMIFDRDGQRAHVHSAPLPDAAG